MPKSPRARVLWKLAALVGVMLLTGCPYTDGCGGDDGATADGGGTSDDGGTARTDSSEPRDDAADTSIPLGPIAPKCVGLAARCGGEDCCASSVVPAGTFDRNSDRLYPATVAAFRLDTYEVTVGRFRAFVNAGRGTQRSPPAEGEGAHPMIAGSGWSAAFNVGLTADKSSFEDGIKCDPALFNAYSEVPGVNDTLPMNCATWFEAVAFCIWDGGRLPTEAEWSYAASGGNEQRIYPWGPTIDTTRASYGCRSGDSMADPGAPLCAFNDYTAVGTRPTGKGRWGHADMAGNVWERVLDYFVDPFRLTPCVGCADLQPNAEGRGIRGGSINWGVSYLRAVDRTPINAETPGTRNSTAGFRCARAL